MTRTEWETRRQEDRTERRHHSTSFLLHCHRPRFLAGERRWEPCRNRPRWLIRWEGRPPAWKPRGAPAHLCERHFLETKRGGLAITLVADLRQMSFGFVQ